MLIFQMQQPLGKQLSGFGAISKQHGICPRWHLPGWEREHG
jgi:hypothetical protein